MRDAVKSINSVMVAMRTLRGLVDDRKGKTLRSIDADAVLHLISSIEQAMAIYQGSIGNREAAEQEAALRKVRKGSYGYDYVEWNFDLDPDGPDAVLIHGNGVDTMYIEPHASNVVIVRQVARPRKG